MARTDTLTRPQATVEIVAGWVRAITVKGVELPIDTILDYSIAFDGNGFETLTVRFATATTVTRAERLAEPPYNPPDALIRAS